MILACQGSWPRVFWARGTGSESPHLPVCWLPKDEKHFAVARPHWCGRQRCLCLGSLQSLLMDALPLWGLRTDEAWFEADLRQRPKSEMCITNLLLVLALLSVSLFPLSSHRCQGLGAAAAITQTDQDFKNGAKYNCLLWCAQTQPWRRGWSEPVIERAFPPQTKWVKAGRKGGEVLQELAGYWIQPPHFLWRAGEKTKILLFSHQVLAEFFQL